MLFGKPNLKTLFDKFKKEQNYPNIETLKDEAEKRERDIRITANQFRKIGETEIAMETEDKLFNKIIAITSYLKELLSGKISYEEAILILEDAINNYEAMCKEFSKKYKKHLKKIKKIRKLSKEEYGILILEKSFA